MKPEYLGYQIEEFDSKGNLIDITLTRFEPLELTWFNDIKSKMHNVVITPLLPDTPNIIKVTNTKKYDSKRLTEANNGL
jgi:hypothetical protein